MDAKKVGAYLQELRGEKSQDEVAKALGIPKAFFKDSAASFIFFR